MCVFFFNGFVVIVALVVSWQKPNSIQRTEDKSEASVFVLNTCSIRDHAEQKVYSYVGPYAIRKQKGENIAIVVAG